MRLYVGITDRTWFDRLSSSQPDEVNFWSPGGKVGFSALRPGELFLFKLHSPNNLIVGGGRFVTFSRLPMSLAWLAFGTKNGVNSEAEFLRRVRKYRPEDPGPDPVVGNIVLAEPFWLPPAQWIPAPADWPVRSLKGKTYDALEGRGYELWAAVRDRLYERPPISAASEERARYGRAEVNLRLGQGAFRVVVTDAYHRRCAVTGEATLDVLEAAHIRPFGQDGPHDLPNGLLLRSDMHILFDRGLLTVTPDLRVEVSSLIREQYSNGRVYYRLQGRELQSLPASHEDCPAPEFLEWHNRAVFRQ